MTFFNSITFKKFNKNWKHIFYNFPNIWLISRNLIPEAHPKSNQKNPTKFFQTSKNLLKIFKNLWNIKSKKKSSVETKKTLPLHKTFLLLRHSMISTNFCAHVTMHIHLLIFHICKNMYICKKRNKKTTLLTMTTMMIFK